jgi:hypothetical protein
MKNRNHIFQKGGDKPFNVNPSTLNRFTDPRMEKHMNPIYGLVLCESGYVPNLYFLKKTELIDSFSKESRLIDSFSKYFAEKIGEDDAKISKLKESFSEYFAEKIGEDIIENGQKLSESEIIERSLLEHAHIINRTCTLEEGANVIKPTNKIMKMDEENKEEMVSESKKKKQEPKITLLDLGRYIAAKYVNKFVKPLFLGIHEKSGDIFITREYTKITKDEKDDIMKSVKFFNKFVKISDIDVFSFHMLLFCLWWKVNTNDRFNDYYKGIQDIFDIVNRHQDYFIKKYSSENIPLIIGRGDSASASASASDSAPSPSASASANKSFEHLVLDINRVEFKIYNQEQSLHFCEGTPSRRYPDCGETTVRNIINILCFNGTKFDIDLLTEKGAIKELKDYYTVFNNFELQSKTETSDIFGMQLNARDAWSKLINMYSQYNIQFGKICNKDTENEYGYDMQGGLTKDETKSNLLQMIQNLITGITDWSDLTNSNIEIVTPFVDETIGVGNIIIQTHSKLEFKVYLNPRHYYIELSKKTKRMSYDYLPKYHQDILNILYKDKITKINYININFTPEKLVSIFSNPKIPEMKFGIFELSFTDKYDDDTRRHMLIDPSSHFFANIADVCGNNERINKYEFLTMRDFEFVRKLPALRVLNLMQNNLKINISTIDLSPLEKIEEIGDFFLYHLENITEVNLKPLENVKTIGKYFLYSCKNANVIGFEHLKKLTTIGDYFLFKNEYLHTTNNTFITKNTPITVDLSNSPIVIIGNHFLSYCVYIKTVKLNPNSIITNIGDEFLSYCAGLKSVDLKCLENIATINHSFMKGCTNLVKVELPDKFTNVTKIERDFMSGAVNLKKIDLSCFSNVKKIGAHFLLASDITKADLSSLHELSEIDKDFMEQCRNLRVVIFSPNFNINKLHFNNEHLIPKLKQGNASVSEMATPSSECAAGSNNSKCTIMGGSKRRRTARKIKKNYRRATRRHK